MRKLLFTLLTVFTLGSVQAQHEVFKALDAGDMSPLEQYINEGKDLNAKYKDYTLLNKAISLDYTDQALALIKSGADVNIATLGKMPLAHAAKNGNEVVVDALLEAGADMFKAYEEDYTIYQIANRAGHSGLAAKLQKAYFAKMKQTRK